MEKYTGRTVDIIYLDKSGNFTQRRIRVHSVHNGIVRAYCTTSGVPRTFRVENILAVQPVVRSA
jgi:predicted DNA-binding transcriptional regulator YafY